MTTRGQVAELMADLARRGVNVDLLCREADAAREAALDAAADNRLYRIAQPMGTPAQFCTIRTSDGEVAVELLDRDAVLGLVAAGILGDLAPAEEIGGVWVERFDLSEWGLDWYLARA